MNAQACEVWVADLAMHRPAHDDLLDGVEQIRADAFVRPVDRTRFTLGAALLKLAIVRSTDRLPSSVNVDRRCDTCGGPHGRPRVRGSDTHVSVSHSGELVAVALTTAGPVGVDAEYRLPGRRMPPAQQFVAAAEPVVRPEDLLTYWCRKESVVKATGEGLRVPLREVVVTPADEAARLVSYRGGTLVASIIDLDLCASYAAALTVLTDGPVTVDIRRADVLLE
jgi:4'-phosphopantetheinyl transferase